MKPISVKPMALSRRDFTVRSLEREISEEIYSISEETAIDFSGRSASIKDYAVEPRVCRSSLGVITYLSTNSYSERNSLILYWLNSIAVCG
jgi:hypothetical protein